jgi:hypothetical protein
MWRKENYNGRKQYWFDSITHLHFSWGWITANNCRIVYLRSFPVRFAIGFLHGFPPKFPISPGICKSLKSLGTCWSLMDKDIIIKFWRVCLGQQRPFQTLSLILESPKKRGASLNTFCGGDHELHPVFQHKWPLQSSRGKVNECILPRVTQVGVEFQEWVVCGSRSDVQLQQFTWPAVLFVFLAFCQALGRVWSPDLVLCKH